MLPVNRPLRTSAPDVNQANGRLPSDDADGQAGPARPERHQSNGTGMTWASVVRQAPLSAHPAAQNRPGTGGTRDASELSAKPEDGRFKQQATNQLKQPVATADRSAVDAPIQSPASVIRAWDRRRPPKSAPMSTANTRGGNGPDRPVAVADALNARILKQYEKGQVGLDSVMKVTTSNIKKATLRNALACVDAMKAARIAPNVIIYSALISSCEREKRADKALEVFDDMRTRHVGPDVITYNALISACEKAGWADEALEVFSDMRDRRVVPGVITYSVLISACGKAGRADKALEVFGYMRDQHVAPNVITYSALISACEKAGWADKALEVFSDMLDQHVAPNVITYNALISACEKAGWADKALKVYGDMRDRTVAPNVITYSALISACEKAGWADKALEVYGDMCDRHVAPDVITYSALISACEKAGRADKALEVFSDMRDRHVAPDVITYNALITACDKGDGRARQQIPQLLRAMVTEGFFHSSLGYASVTNTLDLHVNRILVMPEAEAHIKAVSAAVAKAIFNHHVAEKHISDQTQFIVGRHGNDAIKTAIAECMRHHGLIPVDATMPDGILNPGRLVSRAPVVART